MTPKQLSTLVGFQLQIIKMDRYLHRIMRQLDEVSDSFDCAIEKEVFTADGISKLLCLNQRLTKLELYLCDLGKQEEAKLEERVSDSTDPMDDYEIDATLYFILREDDPTFDDSDDNYLTQRQFSLKRLDREYGLGDGQDHRENLPRFPDELNEVPHCWLFHDLYDHSYDLESPALSLHDCLRVGTIWVDVAVHHQATLDIASGKWEQLIDSAGTPGIDQQ